MINLLQNSLIEHYNISSPTVLKYEKLGNCSFDLDDTDGFVLGKGCGKASFDNKGGEVAVIGYEDFIRQCKRPQSFARGRKRCDFILCHDDEKGAFVLNEITSAYGDESNLALPIKGKQPYPGGKYEKVVDQFVHSLDTLLSVSKIRSKVLNYKKRICLMSYKVIPNVGNEIIHKALSSVYSHRYVESLETRGEGAIIKLKPINDMGFEYRRISHDFSFEL